VGDRHPPAQPPASTRRIGGMTIRHCPRCSAEVDTTDGFCRLGHSVKLAGPVVSPGAFRDELGPIDGGPDAPGVALPPPPPPPDRLGAAPLGRFGALWEEAKAEHLGADPIASFAPYPRMDWGPRWPWRRSLSRRRTD